MTALRIFAALTAALLAPLASAATVTWAFEGNLTEVVDTGGFTPLTSGSRFNGSVVFDTEAEDSVNLFGRYARHTFSGTHGLYVAVGDGAFVSTPDLESDADTLAQFVARSRRSDDELIWFSGLSASAVAAFGRVFEPSWLGASSLTLTTPSTGGDTNAPATPDPRSMLDGAELVLRYVDTVSGNDLVLRGEVSSFAPPILGDFGPAPVPLPASAWLMLTALVSMTVLKRRQHTPTADGEH